MTVGKSAYDKNGSGLLIDPEPILLHDSIVCDFPEVLLVIEGDAAGAGVASVDLAALH